MEEDGVSSSYSSSVFCIVGAEAVDSLPYSALLWQTCSTAHSSQVRVWLGFYRQAQVRWVIWHITCLSWERFKCLRRSRKPRSVPEAVSIHIMTTTTGSGTRLNEAFQRDIPDLGHAVSALCFCFWWILSVVPWLHFQIFLELVLLLWPSSKYPSHC